MPIKIGFSTSVCPDWDIEDIATHANEMGFYGVELGTVRDEIHLPVAEDLQTDKQIDEVRKLFEAHSVELVSLASKYSLEAPADNVAARSYDRTVENIELAAKLRCPFVRVPVGRKVGREPADRTLARTIKPLVELGKIASRNRVALLICNTPDFPSSRAIWFVVDGVSHPAVSAAWNPVVGLSAAETSTLAIPRLGARNRMVLAGDAAYNGQGQFGGFRPIGQGSVDYGLSVDLMKGVLFDGYLMLDWPKAHLDDFPEPADALEPALQFLIDRIKHQDPVLTAYKKDLNAPKWNGAPVAFVQRNVAGKGAGAEEDSGKGEAKEAEVDPTKPRIAKGGDPRIAKLVAEAVAKVRAARAAKGG